MKVTKALTTTVENCILYKFGLAGYLVLKPDTKIVPKRLRALELRTTGMNYHPETIPDRAAEF